MQYFYKLGAFTVFNEQQHRRNNSEGLTMLNRRRNGGKCPQYWLRRLKFSIFSLPNSPKQICMVKFEIFSGTMHTPDTLPWRSIGLRLPPIGGDTHTAGVAIALPLRILGQQPIQNAAPTPTMFIIVIDPFCCNQTLHLGPLRTATNLSPN